MGGGALIVSFNYPLLEQREKDFAKDFFKTALNSKENLYYYPKPNAYTEIDDFALFSLRENITSENLKIESLYRNNLIHRDLRGKLHTLLRKERNIDSKILSKKFFYESRKLFNCSYTWKALEVSQEQLQYDLIDKIEEFYPAPSEINIAITNECNLKCIMCLLHAKELQKTHKTSFFKQKQILDEKKVYEILEYAGNKGVFNVSFTAAGEVLLDDRIFSFVAFAKNLKIPLISLVTNGTLLEQKGIALLKAGLNRMTISIDGATKETYKKIRGTDLEKVERGVRKCVEYARILNNQGADIEFEVACVLVFDEMSTQEQKELYLNKWSDCRDVVKRITFNELATFDENGQDRRNNAVIDLHKRSICMFPYQRMMINPYGDVSVCCTMSSSAYHYPFSVGNVYQHGLEEIWRGEGISILRKENLEKNFTEFSICARCNEWAYNDFTQEDTPQAKEKVLYIE